MNGLVELLQFVSALIYFI